MRSFLSFSSCRLFFLNLVFDSLPVITSAYKPLSDSFLRNISSEGSDFDPDHGVLLSPLLIPRALGTAGHATVQHHFVNFFSVELPRWTMEWYNSSTTTPNGVELPIANLVFKREPPWTKQGQANWLTLAAHYDSKSFPEESVGATDSAVPCAILMHVARSVDRYVTQMYDEMAALGEGGTVEMDMGVQILFLDGKDASDEKGPALYGSRALSETWEMRTNPVGSKYPNALSQISIFVLLDVLGSINPMIPSYFLLTHWAYKNIASLEDRLRNIGLLETSPSSAFFSATNESTMQSEIASDHIPFMERGVPFIQLLPSPLPPTANIIEDKGKNLHLPTVRDWTKIVTGFALEWLDMMEVWPE